MNVVNVEKKFEVSNLSHQFESDLFFPAKGYQLLTPTHPLIPPPPFLPSSFLPSLLFAHCSHCLLLCPVCLLPICIVRVFVHVRSSLTISASVYSGGPLWCDPLFLRVTSKCVCVHQLVKRLKEVDTDLVFIGLICGAPVPHALSVTCILSKAANYIFKVFRGV